MNMYLRNDWKVVVWKTHWIGDDNDTFKDINDLIILAGLQILEMINKNTYSGLRGEWEVSNWKLYS